MDKIRWLHTAYPFEQTSLDKWKTVISMSVLSGFVLFFLQPYGFVPLMRMELFLAYLVFGSLTFAVNYFGIPYLFPSYFDDDKWTISKAFLFFAYTFIIIGLWTHIYHALFIRHDLVMLTDVSEIANTSIKTLVIGSVISGFVILFRYNILTRSHLELSQNLNDYLQSQLHLHQAIPDSDTIDLTLEGKNVNVPRTELMFISSQGNYLGIHTKSGAGAPPHLYRGRIKEMELALRDFPEFFRCHRSFIVNLKHIRGTHGNSQGLSISLDHEKNTIPVARPKIKEFKERIAIIGPEVSHPSQNQAVDHKLKKSMGK